MILDMSRVAVGQLIAQSINLLALPFITRFYKPEIFGVFAVFSAATWILVVLSTLQAEHLIITMRTRRLAKALCFAIFMSIIGFTAFIVITVEFLDAMGWGPTYANKLTNLSLWLGITVAIVALNQVLRFYATYVGQFKAYRSSVILNSIGLVSVTIGYAYFIDGNAPVEGLILGQIIGMLIATIPYFIYTDILLRREWKLVALSARTIRAEMSKLPILIVTHLSKTMSFRIPVFIVASIGGDASAGAYAMADRLISLPTGVFGQAIGQVVRHRFKTDNTDVVRQVEQPRLIIKVSLLLAVLSYSTFIYIADFLILLILGQEWMAVVPFIRILAVMEMMNFVFYSVEDVAVIRGVFVYRMLWQFSQLCLLSLVLLFVSFTAFISSVELAIVVICAIRVIFIAFDLSRTWRNIKNDRLERLGKRLKLDKEI